MAVAPTLFPPAHAHLGILLWRWDARTRTQSSAAVGGGATAPRWTVNIQVPMDYDRIDLAEHVDATVGASKPTWAATFAGSRSPWRARLATAVWHAVSAGLEPT